MKYKECVTSWLHKYEKPSWASTDPIYPYGCTIPDLISNKIYSKYYKVKHNAQMVRHFKSQIKLTNAELCNT